MIPPSYACQPSENLSFCAHGGVNEEEVPTVDRELTVPGELRPMGFKQLDSLRVPISRSVRLLVGAHRQPSRGVCGLPKDQTVPGYDWFEIEMFPVWTQKYQYYLLNIQPDWDQIEIVTLCNDVEFFKIFGLLLRDVWLSTLLYLLKNSFYILWTLMCWNCSDNARCNVVLLAILIC